MCFHSYGHLVRQCEGITLIRTKTIDWTEESKVSEYYQQDTRYVPIDTREAPQDIWRYTQR